MRNGVSCVSGPVEFTVRVRLATMRTTRLSFSPVDYIPEALRAFLARRFAEICGCLLASFGLAASLSLATWSARDPSATYAAEGAARNLLGRPGRGNR